MDRRQPGRWARRAAQQRLADANGIGILHRVERDKADFRFGWKADVRVSGGRAAHNRQVRARRECPA